MGILFKLFGIKTSADKKNQELENILQDYEHEAYKLCFGHVFFNILSKFKTFSSDDIKAMLDIVNNTEHGFSDINGWESIVYEKFFAERDWFSSDDKNIGVFNNSNTKIKDIHSSYIHILNYIHSSAMVNHRFDICQKNGISRAKWVCTTNCLHHENHKKMNGEVFYLTDGIYSDDQKNYVSPGRLLGCCCIFEAVF